VHDKQVRRRRAVLGLLVGLSLILLTAYFGESPSSPLHSVQRGIVQVISPIQSGASTVLSPVKDVAGWFSDTFQAKGQRDRLRREVASLTRQVDYYHQQAILAQQLGRQVGLDQSNSISSYRPVTGTVIGKDPILWYQTIEIDKGSNDGVQVNDPVIGDGALVGKVSTVAPSVSIVQLITDHSVNIAAQVQDQNGDTGLLVPAVGNPNELLLQALPHILPGQPGPQIGQLVVTAGYKAGPLSSLYPRGLPIGQISNASENNLINNNQVQVSPAADLRHLSIVQVLTAPRGGSARAQVP
jgi:rod shape-determining protein MreC